MVIPIANATAHVSPLIITCGDRTPHSVVASESSLINANSYQQIYRDSGQVRSLGGSGGGGGGGVFETAQHSTSTFSSRHSLQISLPVKADTSLSITEWSTRLFTANSTTQLSMQFMLHQLHKRRGHLEAGNLRCNVIIFVQLSSLLQLRLYIIQSGLDLHMRCP